MPYYVTPFWGQAALGHASAPVGPKAQVAGPLIRAGDVCCPMTRGMPEATATGSDSTATQPGVGVGGSCAGEAAKSPTVDAARRVRAMLSFLQRGSATAIASAGFTE